MKRHWFKLIIIWLEYELFCVPCGTPLENVLLFHIEEEKNPKKQV